MLQAELDGALMHLYGFEKVDVEHILNTFRTLAATEERLQGEYRTRRLVLEAYDRMASAIARGGHGWASLVDIPAGQGPRHPQAFRD